MSQSPLIGAFVPTRARNKEFWRRIQVSIPSDRGIRSDQLPCLIVVFFVKSQSPLIGAFVPTGAFGKKGSLQDSLSQSPLIGAFVPTGSGYISFYTSFCLNPL